MADVANAQRKVLIRHGESGDTKAVSPRAAEAHAKRGWTVIDASAPKADVIAAAEAATGKTVDASKTRAAIIEDVAGTPPVTPAAPDHEE